MEFDILKIQQRDKVWKNVSKNDYEIKFLELKKGHPSLHLVYNNDITFKVIYRCQICKKEIETGWGKFVQGQINKNKCLCRNCTMGLKEVRNKISMKTKEAMNNDDLRKYMSKKQNERWKDPIELEKRSLMSKLVAKNIKDGIYDNKKEKKEYSLSNVKINRNFDIDIDKKVSDEVKKNKSYPHDKVSKYAIDSYKTIYNDINKQIKKINATRRKLLKRKSSIQQIVANWLLTINDINIEEEYPINLYEQKIEYKYFFIDIFLQKYNIAIEILGNYWHESFIKYLSLNNYQRQEYMLNLKNKNDKQYKILKKEIFRDNYIKNNMNIDILYISEHEILYENWIIKLQNFLTKKGVIK